jgi:endonuclease/exonuclease/phosphatase family metal-dependent hydrolase
LKRRQKKYPILIKTIFAVNILAAIALLFSYLSAFVNPSRTAFFAVFGLLYLPLFVSNAFFIVFWLIFRWQNLFLSIPVIIAGFFFPGVNFSINPINSALPGCTAIKVLDYNIQRFGLDLPKETYELNKLNIVNFIKSENADIISLQEFHGRGRTLYEPLSKMKTELGSETYYYESYFNPRYEQITGLVIFSKFQAVKKGKLKFEGTRTFGIYTDLLIQGDTVRVFNIHLASIQLTPSDIDFVVKAGQDQQDFGIRAVEIYRKLSEALALRTQQLDFLKEELKASPHPVILSGDFNDTPNSFLYSQITKLLNDTFRDEGNGFGFTYAGEIPFLRIDYVMHNDEFKTISHKRHLVDYSDHYPLTTLLCPASN